MTLRQMLTELLYTLADALETGDLAGHLVVLWKVVAGRVTPDTRWWEEEGRSQSRRVVKMASRHSETIT